MKLRIKANSIRFRLTKSEVLKLRNEGHIEEETSFGLNKLHYELYANKSAQCISASFIAARITAVIPADMIKEWPENTTVGFYGKVMITDTDSLDVLIEKDFVCLDDNLSDQHDNYENPAKTC